MAYHKTPKQKALAPYKKENLKRKSLNTKKVTSEVSFSTRVVL